MKALVKASVTRPVAVLMSWAGALALAGVAAAGIPVRYLPELSVPRIVVTAQYPGYPAEEVRTLLAIPLEDGLAQAKGAVGTRSVSRDGRAVVVVDFSWGESAFSASMRVREAIDAVYRSLPEGAEKPVVVSFDPSDFPLLVAAVRSRDGNAVESRRFAELELKTRLQRAEGIGAAVVVGGAEPEIVVEVDADKAAARGSSPEDIARVIAAENAEYSVGRVREGSTELGVRAGTRATGPSGIAAFRVYGGRGSFAVGETARIEERIKRRTGIFVLDGNEWTGIEVYGRRGASPVAAAAAARATIAELAGIHGRAFEFGIPFDGSGAVVKSVTDLALAAAIGAAAAFAVVALFARDLSASLLIVSTIPVSATIALGALAAAGSTLNTMSLGGLSLGVGMMSDNAVVVLERLRDRSGPDPDSPESMASRVGEVSASTFASTLTSVIVFLPVVFLPGELGAVFADLAWAFVFALLASWLVAITFVPAMQRLVSDPARLRPLGRRGGRIYPKLLKAAFRRPGLAFALAAAVALAGAWAFAGLPVEFMPGDDAGEAIVEAAFPPGTDMERIAAYARNLTASLKGIRGVKSSFARAGGDRRDLRYQADPDSRQELLIVRCPLDPAVFPASDSAAISLAAVLGRAGFGSGDGVAVSAYSPPSVIGVILGTGNGRSAAVFGDDQAEAAAEGARFVSKFRDAVGDASSSVDISPSGTRPAVRIVPDREAAAAAGIGVADAARSAAASLEGSVATMIERDGRELDVRVRAAGQFGVMDLGGIVAAVGENGPALLSDLARPERVVQAEAVARLNRTDAVFVTVRAKPGREREVDAAMKLAAADCRAEIASAGAFERYSKRLALVVALVVLLLYLFLGAQFESFALPGLLLVAIPLSFAGVSTALALAGSSINFGSVLGVVVLFGVSVNNSIILWEVAAARFGASLSGDAESTPLARVGMAARAAAFRGALDRLMPIMVTALTSILALVPVALSPSGAAQRSMAAAVLGGLVVSTSLTLVIAPVVFAWKLSLTRLTGRRPGEPAAGRMETGFTERLEEIA
ncbi:MAG: efflux RND transporter permease subunit [Spirochaetes bacterium]|nr:efflux RND transporter permease subunit [Spirochaetota bacterium]